MKWELERKCGWGKGGERKEVSYQRIKYKEVKINKEEIN